MFPLSTKIWFTAQALFITGLGAYSLFTQGINFGEKLQLGMIVFLFGLACSLPALLILWLLMRWLYELLSLNTKSVLPAIFAGSVAAFVTYSGWCIVLDGSGGWLAGFKGNIEFLLIVVCCTTVATLLHYKSFQKLNAPTNTTDQNYY